MPANYELQKNHRLDMGRIYRNSEHFAAKIVHSGEQQPESLDHREKNQDAGNGDDATHTPPNGILVNHGVVIRY